MKNAITSPECMLLHLDSSSEFELHVDASKKHWCDARFNTQWKAKTCKIYVKMFCKVLVNFGYITSGTFRCKIWVGNFLGLSSRTTTKVVTDMQT